jgi:hypothetical protein
MIPAYGGYEAPRFLLGRRTAEAGRTAVTGSMLRSYSPATAPMAEAARAARHHATTAPRWPKRIASAEPTPPRA